jgi:hypothetical protein
MDDYFHRLRPEDGRDKTTVKTADAASLGFWCVVLAVAARLCVTHLSSSGKKDAGRGSTFAELIVIRENDLRRIW